MYIYVGMDVCVEFDDSRQKPPVEHCTESIWYLGAYVVVMDSHSKQNALPNSVAPNYTFINENSNIKRGRKRPNISVVTDQAADPCLGPG